MITWWWLWWLSYDVDCCWSIAIGIAEESHLKKRLDFYMCIFVFCTCITLTANTLLEQPWPMVSVCYLVCKQSLDDSESEREYGAHRVGRLHLQSAARLHSNQTARVWSESARVWPQDSVCRRVWLRHSAWCSVWTQRFNPVTLRKQQTSSMMIVHIISDQSVFL